MSDWQLDRLPGDVRQEAENAAQQEGLPLHRWLGKLIRETCDEEGIPPARELMRAAPNRAAGNGYRQQPVMSVRPPVEPIRIPPEARAAEPPRPAEQPTLAAANVSYRNGDGHAAPAMEPREPARAEELPRRPERVASMAREQAPPVQPEPGRTIRQAPARQPVARESMAPAATPIARPSEAPRGSQPPRQSAPAAREPVARQPIGREALPPPTSPTLAPAPAARLSTISSLSTAPASATPQLPHGMPPILPMQSASMPSRFAGDAGPMARPPRPEPPRQERASPAVSAAVAPSAAASSVPAALRSDERLSALARLVQGLRRNELSPIGEARLFLKLMTEHMATIGDITVATGRTKEQVARSLRLLGLSDRLRDLIDRGALSREQAFALLDADDPDAANPVIPPSSGYRTP